MYRRPIPNRRALAFVASLVVTLSHAQPVALELKELRLGMNEAELLAKYPWITCKAAHPQHREFYDRECFGPRASTPGLFTLGYSDAKLIASLREDALVRLEVITDEAGTRQALRGVAEKYGETKPYIAAEMSLAGKTCFVSRYMWPSDSGAKETLSLDLNFPDCETGAALLRRDVSRRKVRPDT